MDRTAELIENFKIYLQNHNKQKPIPLYGNNTKKSKNAGTEVTIEPMDIISKVSSEIKALQDADTNRNYKCVRKKIHKYKKSGFLPLNLMPTYVEVTAPNPPYNFKLETQCVSNTQLVSIVENAEALIDPFRGKTQDYKTTFTNKENNNITTMDKVLSNDCNKNTINIESKIGEFQKMCDSRNSTMDFLDNNINSEHFKVLIEDEDWSQLEMAGCQIQSVSPILKDVNQNNPNSILNDMNILDRKSNTPSPLVVSLEYYEKFENMAVPFIKDNLDLTTTKHLINSQIINKEMSIFAQSSNNKDFIVNNLLINASEPSKNPVNHISYNDNECHDAYNREHENLNNTFEDEILFSSDEEGFMDKIVQDLPLTCALQTTSENQSDILNSTMYVGFQTASNKSIQISSKSFTKAKSVLGEPERSSDSPKPTITDLVEMADINNKNDDSSKIGRLKKIDLSQNHINITTGNGNIMQPSISKDTLGFQIIGNSIPISENTSKQCKILCQELDKKENDINASMCEFDSLKTAKNMIINVPKQTLAGCQKVFSDINFKKNCESDINDCKINTNRICVKNKDVQTFEHAVGDIINVFNDDMNKNIEKNIKIKQAGPIFLAFKTDSNKNIGVSNQAFCKVFEDIDNVGCVKNFGQNFACKNKHMHGFKTASNKQIIVTEQAYSKTKRLFQDLEMDYMSSQNGSDSPCVKKLINRNIEISEQALSRLKDIEVKDTPEIPTNKSLNKKTGFAGFKAASHISVRALPKTKTPFQEINEIDINKITESIPSNYHTDFLGFKTASNKHITISEKALAKVEGLFQDLERGDIPQIIACSTFKTTFAGLEQASNKKITKQALAETRNKYQDTNVDISRMIASSNSNTDATFAGFKTASNKVIKISQQALSKTKTLFEDINLNNVHDINKESDLTTANNKVLQSSEQAFAQTKLIFEEMDPENDPVKGNNLGKPKQINDTLNCECKSLPTDDFRKNDFQEFEIASANSVQVSADINSEYKNNILEMKFLYCDQNKAIKNATNQKKHIFGEIDIEASNEIFEYYGKKTENNKDDNFVKNKTISPFRGFQTASKKQVKISEEALAKSKLLLEVIQTENNFHIGFKTASNNKIEINKEALAKARNLLRDLDVSQLDRQERKDVNHNFEANITDKNIVTPKQLIVSDNKMNMERTIIESKTTVVANDNNVSIDNVIDTQILNDFEKTLCTEDFCKDLSLKPIKRSVSPIFLCPKAKKRKRFETPFKINSKVVLEDKIQTKLKPEIESNFLFDIDYKKNKNVKLKDLEKIETDNYHVSEVDPYILNFTFDTLLDFEFFNKRNNLTNTKMNINSLKEYFLAAVNENLIPEGWLDNHLKLLLWKLISYEMKFSNSMKNVVTAKNVLQQLKYRYDREIYNVERPALRKILERDDVSTRTIILCVVKIYEDGTRDNCAANINNNVELLLSDGWYLVKATIDKMLTKLVCNKKIVVGSKIVIHGAELLNCEQGMSPLEDTSLIRLKLSGNSTRLARWDARLGYHSNAAILTNLSTVKPEGGRVSKLRLFVTRVYPMLYVEKFEDGSTVTRSERLENLYQMKYETERQILLEKLYEEVEIEHSDQSNLTNSQSNLLEDYTLKQREKLLQNLNRKFQNKLEDKGLNVSRNVVGLMKIRVADIEEKKGSIEVTKGMMSIWKPNDAITEMINEGSWIEVLNVVPTAIRYSEVQLSASRQSVFIQSKFKENDIIKPFTKSLMRTCYEIKDLVQKPTLTTDNNEIDIVGLIFLIEPSIKEFDSIKDKNFQNVYLTDADKNLICANFWGGLKKFGFENALETGQIVAGINLQKRAGNSRKSIPQFRVTEFSYFTKTPKSESAKKIREDLIKKMSGVDRRKFCDDCLVLKENFSNVKLQGNENITPYRVNNSDYNMNKNRMLIETPLAEKNRIVDDNFNLTGLDFESTFQTRDTQDFSPDMLLRKKRFNEKMAKLKMYREPPPLGTIHILNKSKNAEKAYKSPVISKIESVTNTEKKLPEGSLEGINQNSTTPTSPIIQMNRTFVKRNNVNPVKLNFSNNVAVDENSVTNLVNHFAEEFEGSPPLSLDSSDCI